LTTQHVEALPVGASALGLVLSPHGHVEHELHLVDDGTTTWITVEPGEAASLVEHLDRMRFLLRVEVADVSDGYAVVGEPVGTPHPRYPSYVLPHEFGDLEAHDDASRKYVPHRPATWVGREVVVPRAELAAYVAGRPGAGTWAWEALRVAAGVPRLGFETDHRTLPQEVGWVPSAVHLDKGCYRGQETVARVHNLGRPPRRLVQLHLDGSAGRTPERGEPVSHEGRAVGTLTSVALHADLGPVGLAIVKRSVPVDADLRVGADDVEPVAASQEVVVVP
jgi:folate-binding protein YgfZ